MANPSVDDLQPPSQTIRVHKPKKKPILSHKHPPMTIMSTRQVLSLLLVMLLSNGVASFHFASPGISHSDMRTELRAWSMPTPDMSALTSMKSTWYQECNPTARKTVYNDVFLDYGNADEIDDGFWTLPGRSSRSTVAPTVKTTSSELSAPQPRGPLRKVAKWARRQISGGQA